jgi:drug/metabolite transporter (DMT)-like permease
MYGTNFGSVKILEEAMPASMAAAVRFTMATVVLLPMLRGLKREVFLPAVEAGLYAAAGYYAQGVSLESGGADASTAAFLCSLAVVVCPLLDLVQGTRSLGKRELASVGMAVAG